jgi:hypothetical protein
MYSAMARGRTNANVNFTAKHQFGGVSQKGGRGHCGDQLVYRVHETAEIDGPYSAHVAHRLEPVNNIMQVACVMACRHNGGGPKAAKSLPLLGSAQRESRQFPRGW